MRIQTTTSGFFAALLVVTGSALLNPESRRPFLGLLRLRLN